MSKFVLFAAAMIPLWIGAAVAEEEGDATPTYMEKWIKGEPADPSEDWELAFGGRLYTQWAEALDRILPAETHPSYPATGKKKGFTTWRCVECHGWDYKGVTGINGKGEHYTGIKGIKGMVGEKPEKVVSILRDNTHRYTEQMIPNKAAQRLALFVTKGQYDTETVIDPVSKKFKGNADKGKGRYQNLCAVCHGYDGKAQNFGNSKAPEFLGTIASENPWELLHNARNGHPGQPMPANQWMDMPILLDIGAYAQTLPIE